MGNLATTLPVWRSALVDVRAPRCSGVPVDHHDRDRVHGEASTVNLGARRVWRECLAKNEKKKEEKETDRTSSQTHTGSSHMYCAPTHRGGHVMCTTLLPGSGAGTCARGKNRTGPRTVGGVVAPPTTTRAAGRPSRKQEAVRTGQAGAHRRRLGHIGIGICGSYATEPQYPDSQACRDMPGQCHNCHSIDACCRAVVLYGSHFIASTTSLLGLNPDTVPGTCIRCV